MSETPKVGPAPHPPVDSAVNDKTFEGGVGEHKPLYPDGLAQTQSAAPPSVNRPMASSDDVPVTGAGDPAKLRAAAEAKAAAELTTPDEEDPSVEGEDEPDSQTKAEKRAAKKASKK